MAYGTTWRRANAAAGVSSIATRMPGMAQPSRTWPHHPTTLGTASKSSAYALTDRGNALIPALAGISLWAQEHLPETSG